LNGVIPTRRVKARENPDWSLKPQAAATSQSERSDSDINAIAAAIRDRST
jgi:hypothetical protein